MSSEPQNDAEERPARTWPHVITLKSPVQYGSDTVTKIEVRRGRLGDLKGIKLGNEIATDSILLVASRMCGQPMKVIEGLGDEDSEEVVAIVLDFFGKCLGGGRTP